MYSKVTNSWLKHWDFILLDLVMLQTAYVLSYVIRQGAEILIPTGYTAVSR